MRPPLFMPQPGPCGPPALEDLSLAALATHIAAAPSLAGLPEELTLRLWHAVLARGGLTPGVLRVFTALGHESVNTAAASAVVDAHAWTPPILSGGHRPWLGDKPAWQGG